MRKKLSKKKFRLNFILLNNYIFQFKKINAIKKMKKMNKKSID